jgi:hypothetical protein
MNPVQIDVLDLVAPSQSFMDSSYLVSPTTGGNPTITYVSPIDDEGIRQLTYIKGWLKDATGKPIVNPDGSYRGVPWDLLSVTSYTDPVTGKRTGWFRQRLTENIDKTGPTANPSGWSDAASGKLLFGLGARRLPRYVDESGDMIKVQFLVTRPESDYLIFGPGGLPIARNTDSNVQITFRGPYEGLASGDLLAGTDWFEDYEWSGKLVNGVMIYNVKETVSHRHGYGRTGWASYPSDGKGGYLAATAQSFQNKIMPLPAKVIPYQKVF